MADAPKFNLRNPSVKRIMQEMKEFRKDESPELYAEALESNIFEWHFVVRGAPDSEFEGGLYHGRILLPSEYPFKPPSFLMLTPNGRFETGVKVCLSISSHHPEHWQPSWSIRTALVALIAFMQTPGNGAIGSLDHSKEERKECARRSKVQPPNFGNEQRQAITNAAHEEMLRREKLLPAAKPADAAGGDTALAAAAAAAAQQAQPGEPGREGDNNAAQLAAAAAAAGAAAGAPQPQAAALQMPAVPGAELRQRATSAAQPDGSSSIQYPVAASPAPPPQLTARAQPAAAACSQQTASSMPPSAAATPPYVPAHNAVAAPHSWEETGLTLLAAALIVALVILLLRKVIVGFSALDATSQSFL